MRHDCWVRCARSILCVLVLAGCADEGHGSEDTKGPMAQGVLSLAPGVTADGYNGIAIWLLWPNDWQSAGSMALPATWPVSYYAGGGFGDGPTGAYTVRAWLAYDEHEMEPTLGAPHRDATVMIACNHGCVVAADVPLELTQ